MKILYIITQANWGGAQKYIFDLATSEYTKEYEVEVAFGAEYEGELAQKLHQRGIKTHKLKHLKRQISILHDKLAVLELRKLYKTVNPDIIHLNSSKAGIIGAFAHIGIKSKLLYTVHGWVFNEPMNPIKKQLWKFLEKVTAKLKDKIICVSEFDHQIGIKNKIAKENKLVTVHNGIEKINFLDKDSARQKLNLPQEKTIIGSIGNFYTTKGFEYLIKAGNKSSRDLIFAILGEGKLRPELEKLIKENNLQDNFILLGNKGFDAAKYLKAFDIYVCSSVKEGLPYAIMEAMSAQLPIISTDIGGIPELITGGKNGLLVEPKNPEAIAEKIKYLIANPDTAKQLAERAKQDAIKKFSKEKMIAKTFNQY